MLSGDGVVDERAKLLMEVLGREYQVRVGTDSLWITVWSIVGAEVFPILIQVYIAVV
jgi:hypothetical protein